MPLLTPDNLGYLARGVRRWLYGELRDSPPECRAQWEAQLLERTGRVAWLFVFGPESNGGIVLGEPYRLLWNMGLADNWSDVAGIGGRLECDWPLERSLADVLQKCPPGFCDVVVVFLERNWSTSEGLADFAALADADFKQCRDRTGR